MHHTMHVLDAPADYIINDLLQILARAKYKVLFLVPARSSTEITLWAHVYTAICSLLSSAALWRPFFSPALHAESAFE